MPVESSEDRATFLEDFGVTVTWTVGGEPVEIEALFERPSIDVEMAEIAVIDRDATLKVIEDDIPAGAAENDIIVVEDVTPAFKVRAIRKDGSGFAVIDLKKA